MTADKEAAIVYLRERGIGSSVVARAMGITRREVNAVMRRHARRRQVGGGGA